MKIHCPNNHDHKKFVTTLYVMQERVVDEYGVDQCGYGDMIDMPEIPGLKRRYTCLECGAEAVETKTA